MENNELVFIDEQLENVIVALEENYNISIHIKGLNIDSDLFTGKVPSNDLLNALEILKYSYHMDYCVDAKDIYFPRNNSWKVSIRSDIVTYAPLF